MSRNSWLASLALALLAAAPARAAEPSRYGVFPDSFGLFRRLLADPREIQLAGSFYHQEGRNKADVALGHSWGMARWYSKERDWAFQWDLEAMAYSRFHTAGSLNEFETIDFFANVPIEARSRWASGKFMIFHQSSHLGDDYIRRTGNTGFRYSVDGLKGILSADVVKYLRVYGGGGYLLRMIPEEGRSFGQAGVELNTGELGLWSQVPSSVYLAEDLQWRQAQGWGTNSRTVLGWRVGFKGSTTTMRVFVGYYRGRSPFGQFFMVKEDRADVGVAFDL